MPASIFLEGCPSPLQGDKAGSAPSGLRGPGLARSGPRGQTSDKGAALGGTPSPAAHTLVWGAAAVARHESGPIVAGTSCFRRETISLGLHPNPPDQHRWLI